MTTAVGWAPIIKSEKRSDGTIVITGKAADSSLDRDYQIADPSWLDKALGQWYGEPDGGNIREQHDGHRAVGTAIEYRKGDDGGHYITAEIIDPVTALKVEKGVLKGFSWSARNARVTTDKAAAGGRIVAGQIYEVSVVDRPANPSCLFTVAKADDGGELHDVEAPEFVEVEKAESVEVIEKTIDIPSRTTFSPADLARALKKSLDAEPDEAVEKTVTVNIDTSPNFTGDDLKRALEKVTSRQATRETEITKSDDGECPKCGADVDEGDKFCSSCGAKLSASKADGGESDAAPEPMPMWGDELAKFVSADKRKEYAKTGVAMPNGDFPIPDEGHLKSAIGHLGNYTGDKAKAKAHIIKRARALKLTNLLPDEWGVSKAFEAVDALQKHLADAGIELSKVDAEAAQEEGADISDTKTAIGAIARLIVSEAEELAEGHLCEIDDIQMLCAAACALRCFIDNEADEIASHAAPTESAMKTDKPAVSTEEDTVETETTEKTEAAPEGELTKTDLSEMLEAAIAKARKPLEDELQLVKADLARVLETPRPDGPARTRTSTHTAHAAKADELRTEIALCQRWIPSTSGDLQKGYRERLDEAEAELKKLSGAA